MDRFNLFRIFVQVVDSSSFSRAADVTGLSRSSVSVAVKELEARLGVRLLNRTTRRMAVTQEGATFYDHCRRLLEDVAEAEGLFRAARAPSGRLRVNLPGRIGRLIVAPQLPDFLARYPGIDVTLGVTDRAVDMLDEGADCVLRVGQIADSGMIVRTLGELPIVTVASHAYLAEHGVPQGPDELDGHQAIHYCSPTTGKLEPFEWMVGSIPDSRMLPGRVTVNGAEAYIACALAGLGLIQVPAYDVRHHLERGELVEVMPDYRAAPMPMAMLFPHRRHLPHRTRLFADWLQGLMAEAIAPHSTEAVQRRSHS